jgi:succinate-semialdehyde dehydrogenase / glutarate-semialdehyde dehydrogenase
MSDMSVNAQEATAGRSYPRIGLYIDGEWIYDRPACHELRNPSDESLLGPVPRATAGDLERALNAASRGFKLWRDTAPEKRAALLLRVADLMRERIDVIAPIITMEQGKPIVDARAEVERARTFLEWDAAQLLRTYGIVAPSEPGMQRTVIRQPIGPVAAFTPWNVPISSPSRKISASLAAGCSVVIKAAEETPGAACAFIQCFIDAGLAAGTLNLVFGDPTEISSTLIASPVIRMVTLTGSVPVGMRLSQLAGAAMKPVLMELGGHAPVLISDDVDVAQVARLAVASKMRMAGQICASPSRFIVVERAYAEFVSAFAAAASEIRVGDGFAPNVQMGPVINARRLAAMEALVADARACGARVAAGGHRIGDRGYFYAPTILADLPPHANVMTTEPFGPLGACVSVKNLEAGLTLANSLSVGLSAYAFTNSLQDAERITRELECGVLSINHFGAPGADMPFGGVKESGIGREGGAESLDAYLVSKTVLQKTTRT